MKREEANTAHSDNNYGPDTVAVIRGNRDGLERCSRRSRGGN